MRDLTVNYLLIKSMIGWTDECVESTHSITPIMTINTEDKE
jgi:hypothetical protein